MSDTHRIPALGLHSVQEHHRDLNQRPQYRSCRNKHVDRFPVYSVQISCSVDKDFEGEMGDGRSYCGYSTINPSETFPRVSRPVTAVVEIHKRQVTKIREAGDVVR
jgi:hypothetical protein